MVNQARMRFQSKQAKWPTSTKEVSGKKLAPEQAQSLDMRSQGPFRRGSDAVGRQPMRRPTLILKENVYSSEASSSCGRVLVTDLHGLGPAQAFLPDSLPYDSHPRGS